MAARDNAGADRRGRILEVARRRFARDSFESTTMRQIAEEASISVGTLYAEFRDKASIAEAISTADLEQATRLAFASLPTGSVREQLAHVFRVFYEYQRADEDIARVVVQELSVAKDANSPLREQRFLELFMSLSNLVAEAQSRGEIVPDVDPFDLAVNAFGLHYFYLVGWLAGQPAFDPPEVHLERALGLLFRGLET